MENSNETPWLNSCRIICTLLAIAAGLFVAAICMHWLGLHGLVAAVIGMFVALILSYLLPDWLCDKDLFGLNAGSAVAAGGVAAAGATAAGLMSSGDATASAPAAAAPKPAKKAAAPKAAKKAPAKKAPAKKAAAKKPAAKKAAASKPPALYTSRPDSVDDLKLISGIGPKLEKTCNSVGVYQFAQIANWKKADIAMVDDKLSFKGRIERDDWVKQAKKLMKG